MNMDELRIELKECEDNMTDYVNQLFADFEKKTGRRVNNYETKTRYRTYEDNSIEYKSEILCYLEKELQ